jgi:type IV secretory pathway VirJ component
MIHYSETQRATQVTSAIPPVPSASRSRGSRARRRARGWFLALVVAVAVVGLARYVGYIGGSVFTVVPADRPASSRLNNLAAVFVSGDAGFRIGMGPKIAKSLADHGIPVVGVNSLTFFRAGRSPAENDALIAEATRRALGLPGVRRVVLVGQSFGADMLQAGLPALPEPLRQKVLLVALIVPGETIVYRASPDGLLDLGPDDPSAQPTARKLDWVPTICIKGQVEDGSLCPLLDQANVTHVALPGGHMLHHDASAVSDVVLKAISAVASGPSSVAAIRLGPSFIYPREKGTGHEPNNAPRAL